MNIGRSARHGSDMRHQTIPIDRTSCDLAEIVEEIMDNLRPWTCPEPEVEAGIQQAIESLKTQIPDEERFSDQSGIRKSAQDIGAAIAKVEAAIAEMEESLRRIHPAVQVFLFDMWPPPDPSHKTTSDFYQNELRQQRISCERL